MESNDGMTPEQHPLRATYIYGRQRLTLFEAMAFDKPILAMDVPAYRKCWPLSCCER